MTEDTKDLIHLKYHSYADRIRASFWKCVPWKAQECLMTWKTLRPKPYKILERMFYDRSFNKVLIEIDKQLSEETIKELKFRNYELNRQLEELRQIK